MYINKWHITFFETKTEGVPSCDIHIAPTPSRRGAQCCASEGRGGSKCPKEQPRVPDSSPGSLANVARWARGVGSGLPRGPAAGGQAVLQSWAWAEVGHPSSRHSNAKSGRCRCPSQAVDSLGIAPVSPIVCPPTAHSDTHTPDTRDMPWHACTRPQSSPTSGNRGSFSKETEPLTDAHAPSPGQSSFNKINPSTSLLLTCCKIHL